MPQVLVQLSPIGLAILFIIAFIGGIWTGILLKNIPNLNRFTLRFDKESTLRLKEEAELYGHESSSEFVCYATAFYSAALNEILNGRSIQSVSLTDPEIRIIETPVTEKIKRIIGVVDPSE